LLRNPTSPRKRGEVKRSRRFNQSHHAVVDKASG
jgi:hypothetical protein